MEKGGKKKRCSFCHKASVILVECNRCKQHFCIKDRLSESHQCPALSFTTEEKIILPKIVPMKIEKV